MKTAHSIDGVGCFCYSAPSPTLEDDMSRAQRRGGIRMSLVELMVVIGVGASIVVVIGLGGPTGIINIFRSVFNRSHLQGFVVETPTGKLMEGKVGVHLRTSAGVQIINCDSTQCSSLKPGSEVLLDCYTESNWPGPPETECRYEGLVTPAPTQEPAPSTPE